MQSEAKQRGGRRYGDRHRALINAIKQRPCADCGRSYPPYVMDFDHRVGTIKRYTIGASASCGMAALLAEIEKCDVVCANCHRERTAKRLPPSTKSRAYFAL